MTCLMCNDLSGQPTANAIWDPSTKTTQSKFINLKRSAPDGVRDDLPRQLAHRNGGQRDRLVGQRHLLAAFHPVDLQARYGTSVHSSYVSGKARLFVCHGLTGLPLNILLPSCASVWFAGFRRQQCQHNQQLLRSVVTYHYFAARPGRRRPADLVHEPAREVFDFRTHGLNRQQPGAGRVGVLGDPTGQAVLKILHFRKFKFK